MPDGSEALNGRTSVQDLLREARERRAAWRREHAARSAEALRERQAEVRRMTGAGERTTIDEAACLGAQDGFEAPAMTRASSETVDTSKLEAPTDSDETVAPETATEIVAEAPAPVTATKPTPAPAPVAAVVLPGAALRRLGSLWMGVGAMNSSSGGELPAVGRSGQDSKPLWARARVDARTRALGAPNPTPLPGPAPGSGDGIRFRRVDTGQTHLPVPRADPGLTPFQPPQISPAPVTPAPGGTPFRRTDAGFTGSAGSGSGVAPAWARQVRPGG